MTFYQLRHFLRYKLLSRHRKGFGVHPPFAFRLITQVVHGEAGTYEDLRVLRRKLYRSRERIRVVDHGAGSAGPPVRSLGRMTRRSSVPEHYGSLLYRLAREFGGKKMLELGTHSGISALCLNAGRPGAILHTVEGDPTLAARAQEIFRQEKRQNIRLYQSAFLQQLTALAQQGEQYDLVFLDGNHTYKGTMDCYKKLKPLMHSDTVLIIDDIRYSREMGLAWKKILQDPGRTLAIDLFRMGIVFYRKKLTPGYYLTKY